MERKEYLSWGVTEEGIDIVPVRSEMTDTPGKFVGTERRDCLFRCVLR